MSTTSSGTRPSLLRPDDDDRSDRVTYVELFFDLIFVFALTQLSRAIAENDSAVGAVESALLILALWWVWIHTTWVTNWLDPARLPVRGAVLALAMVGFVMSVSIYESFGDRGIVFAIAYVTLQLGRTAVMLAAVARHDASLRAEFTRVMIWLSASGAFWIAGALLPLGWRLPLWIVAIAIEYLAGLIGYRLPGATDSRLNDWGVSGAHIAERTALFVIIAIGESLLVTGFAFVEQESSVPGVIAMLSAFASGVALWWLYFDHAERAGSKAVEGSAEPGRLARIAYTYVHVLIIAGIVVTAVADKSVVTHPEDRMSIAVAVTTLGGPALYLAGLALFRWVVSREVLTAHLGGIVLLALLALGAPHWSPLTLGVASTATLLVTASIETIVRIRRNTDDPEAG